MAEQIVVSEQALGYLNETRPWVKFLAIVGFVFLALMVGMAFVMMFAVSAIPVAPGREPMSAGFGMFFGLFYLAFAVLYFMPCLFMYRYGKAIAAIPSAGQSALEDALRNQKSLWKFMGILTAVVVCIYGFFLLIGLLIVLVTHH